MPTPSASTLGAREAFFAFVKLSEKDMDAAVDFYLCAFNQRYRSANEFDRRRYRSEARRSIEDGVRNAESIISQAYLSNVRVSAGEYDFERGGFHLSGTGFSFNVTHILCPTLNAFFTNRENFSFLEVEEERAQTFIRRSNITRTILVRTLYVIDTDTDGFSFALAGGGLALPVRIQRITVYEVDSQGNRTNRVLGVLEK